MEQLKLRIMRVSHEAFAKPLADGAKGLVRLQQQLAHLAGVGGQGCTSAPIPAPTPPTTPPPPQPGARAAAAKCREPPLREAGARAPLVALLLHLTLGVLFGGL